MPGEKIIRGLTALAGAAENYNMASAMLKDQGINDVSAGDLRNWRRQYPSDYNRICENGGKALEEFIAQDCMAKVARYSQAEIKVVEALETRVRDGKEANPAKALESLAKAKDINLSKALTLQGRPSEIKETRSPLELVKFLTEMKVLVPQLPEGD